MTYNYSKLNGRIVEICGSSREFAKQMGLSERTVSLKLNNNVPFKQTDIEKAKEVLKLSDNDIQSYFFTRNVQTNDDKSDSVKKPKKSKKVGRNDPCPCGSGRKYKQCCGK